MDIEYITYIKMKSSPRNAEQIVRIIFNYNRLIVTDFIRSEIILFLNNL